MGKDKTMRRNHNDGSLIGGLLVLAVVVFALIGIAWVLANYPIWFFVGVVLFIVWWKWYFRGL